jgi:hypothetical protein
MTARQLSLGRYRLIAALMALEAASLAVASTLHLASLVHGRGPSFSATWAGAAEAVVGLVLLSGATTLARRGTQGRPAALAATGFATAGFIYGLSITAQAGDLPDITYHATVLPLLILTLVLIIRAKYTDRG